MAIEVIYGKCEPDLFDGPGQGHRTYRADGRWLTGTESFDSATYCDMECVLKALDAKGYSPSEDERFWWLRRTTNPFRSPTYLDAEIYDDIDFRNEMAPYICETCDKVLSTCVLTGADGEYADDCSTHEHEVAA